MDNEKKDLTGILDLQKLQAENPDPVASEVPEDPFAVNELQAIEQVDTFESIDQIGMMDHTPPEEIIANPFAVDAPFTADDSFAATTEPAVDPVEDSTLDQAFNLAMEETTPAEELTPTEANLDDFSNIPEPELPPLSKIKNYSEQSQGKTNLEVKINYPFHLKINGNFGPFERDKLLIFITENPIGLASAELDLQIQASKVFLPRISEYAAIKLVQELRDSGLEFNIYPSDQEEAENNQNPNSSLSFHYKSAEQNKSSSQIDIPIFNLNSLTDPEKPFQQIDEVSIIQYVRTDMLEVENSTMIQEVIERMTETLKQKARLKGGNALLGLKQEIQPLRLPSQYQISLKASVIKI